MFSNFAISSLLKQASSLSFSVSDRHGEFDLVAALELKEISLHSSVSDNVSFEISFDSTTFLEFASYKKVVKIENN